MKPPAVKTIDGTQYTLTLLGARQGLGVLTRLKTLFAGALKGGGTTEEKIAGALDALTETDVTFLCDTFAKLCTVRIGEKEPRLSDLFDEHFSGSYEALIHWLLFCLEANFSSFLGLAGIKLPQATTSG